MAAEWREAKEMMRRGALFLANHKLAPALRSWLVAIGAAGDIGERKARTEKALRHLLHRGLSRGWLGWHAQWREAVRERERARHTAKLLKVRVRVRASVRVS